MSQVGGFHTGAQLSLFTTTDGDMRLKATAALRYSKTCREDIGFTHESHELDNLETSSSLPSFFPDQDLSTEPNQRYHFVDFPSHAWDRCASPSRCRALEYIQSYPSCQLFTRATNQSCSGCSVADVAASQRILHAEKALYTLYNFSIPGMITFTS